MKPIPPSGHADDVWDRAIASVNAWRGHAIQCFAQTEAAVSETLLTLANIEGRGGSVRLRRLVGQRFQDLQDALTLEGPFAAEGAAAGAALAAFREHEAVRAALCHGIAKIALDRHGRWLVVFRTLAFRGRDEERSGVTYEQPEADAFLADLKARGQKLGSALGALRAALRRGGN